MGPKYEAQHMVSLLKDARGRQGGREKSSCAKGQHSFIISYIKSN